MYARSHNLYFWKDFKFLAQEVSGLFPKSSAFQVFFIVSSLIGLSCTFYQIEPFFYVQACSGSVLNVSSTHSQTDIHGRNNEKVLLLLKKWLKWCNKSNDCGEGCYTGVIICAVGSQTLHLSGVVWTAHFLQGPKHSNSGVNRIPTEWRL